MLIQTEPDTKPEDFLTLLCLGKDIETIESFNKNSRLSALDFHGQLKKEVTVVLACDGVIEAHRRSVKAELLYGDDWDSAAIEVKEMGREFIDKSLEDPLRYLTHTTPKVGLSETRERHELLIAAVHRGMRQEHGLLPNSYQVRFHPDAQGADEISRGPSNVFWNVRSIVTFQRFQVLCPVTRAPKRNDSVKKDGNVLLKLRRFDREIAGTRV